MSTDLTQNKEWVKKVEARFDTLGLNENGCTTLDAFLTWPETLAGLCDADPQKLEKFRDNLKLFWMSAGVTPGKEITKKEFVQGLSRLAQADMKRKQSGEETVYEKLHNALFDVMDKSNDGTLNLEEVKIMMKTLHGMDQPGAAESLFKRADKNNSGKVKRAELIDLKFNFWFNPDGRNTKDLFAGAFE